MHQVPYQFSMRVGVIPESTQRDLDLRQAPTITRPQNPHVKKALPPDVYPLAASIRRGGPDVVLRHKLQAQLGLACLSGLRRTPRAPVATAQVGHPHVLGSCTIRSAHSSNICCDTWRWAACRSIHSYVIPYNHIGADSLVAMPLHTGMQSNTRLRPDVFLRGWLNEDLRHPDPPSTARHCCDTARRSAQFLGNWCFEPRADER